jgi:hypothetical protein
MRYLALLALTLGCSVAVLPPEKCTPALQSSYLSKCQLAVELECEVRPETCPDAAICQELLADLCPADR